MFPIPFSIRPEDATQELLDMNRKALDGIKTLSGLRESDYQIGQTPKDLVLDLGLVKLYRYRPLVPAKDVFPIPMIVAYALVNRPYMVDLQEDRSMIRNLLKQGMDLYIIDWGYPQRNDEFLSLEDYIFEFIGDCVDYVREAHNLDQINLMGICQGGVFSLCYTAVYPEKIKNLVTMVTMVDYHKTDSLLNAWMGCTSGGQKVFDVDQMVDTMKLISGDFLNFGFLMLKPFELNLQKYLGLLDIADDETKSANFLRMEKWIFDSPHQAGVAWREFVKIFFEENTLVKGEPFQIGPYTIDMKKITMPVLNLYAEEDHLVRPMSTLPLKDVIPTKDYTVKSFPVGHIGMYVSGKVQSQMPPAIAEWLKARG